MNPAIMSRADIAPTRVILIVLDTVRAESLSLYGGRARTANLEAFGRDALVFENCIAPAPWTVPSHASIFTGLHPIEHGCPVDPRAVPTEGVNFFAANPLQDEAQTLAEIFQQKGFITAGISSNGLVFHPKHNLGQGFQIRDADWGVGKIYQNSFKAPLHLFCALTGLWPQAVLSYRTADVIAAKALGVLEKAAENPIFLFVNFLDAHGPYYPPSPFAAEVLKVRFPQFERFRLFLGRYFFNRIDQKTWDLFQLAQYEAEITWLDSQLGLFFERLKQMEMYDDSLLIVTSDHGELLGEHDLYGHTTPMYDLVLRVPLIIKFPVSRQTGRVKVRVALSDIFPTILRACDSAVPHYVSARPLQVHGLEDRAVAALFFNGDFGRHVALYKDQYKYMDFQKQHPNQLYDLQKDPYEKNNQIAALPDVSATMKSSLEDWLQRNHALFEMRRETREVSDRDLEGLRALGYLQ
jgi:arylsulfatase A-like enzyme